MTMKALSGNYQVRALESLRVSRVKSEILQRWGCGNHQQTTLADASDGLIRVAHKESDAQNLPELSACFRHSCHSPSFQPQSRPPLRLL